MFCHRGNSSLLHSRLQYASSANACHVVDKKFGPPFISALLLWKQLRCQSSSRQVADGVLRPQANYPNTMTGREKGCCFSLCNIHTACRRIAAAGRLLPQDMRFFGSTVSQRFNYRVSRIHSCRQWFLKSWGHGASPCESLIRSIPTYVRHTLYMVHHALRLFSRAPI